MRHREKSAPDFSLCLMGIFQNGADFFSWGADFLKNGVDFFSCGADFLGKNQVAVLPVAPVAFSVAPITDENAPVSDAQSGCYARQ